MQTYVSNYRKVGISRHTFETEAQLQNKFEESLETILLQTICLTAKVNSIVPQKITITVRKNEGGIKSRIN